ncbi:MAG: hydrogenase [Deltaproteobacteria bacterium RIFOXYA12_FULL_58_15]|nr:MAG: hydrogenase [Deltaproteobacteria bacterium RIFOXYA12_FULL_58_15]OGR14349.1 MAG: hydrogenase [Deltaproteobacteria bacterium RIFOXYB12_FULL_58_9]
MKTLDLNVNVHHLARVEGHGNIKISIKGGKIEEARWEVVETPRFFEVMLKGKHYTSAGILTARICGICSIGHCLASVRATENAFGVLVPPLAQKLRLLAKHAETLQSHVLHLFFLSAPDFLGLPSAIPLVEKDPETFAIAARLKNLANRICDAVAGRTTHPVSIQVGGMAVMPDKKALAGFGEELIATSDDLQRTFELFKTFEIPAFERETEFVSLKGDGSYPWIGGQLISSDGVVKNESEYLAMTNEYVSDGFTSKLCKLSRDAFAVGALARVNNNRKFLVPTARLMAAELGLLVPSYNPYMCNVAQLLECVHVVHESIDMIREMIDSDDSIIMSEVEAKASRGVGAVEVPRGILYHDYEYGDDGRVIRANCVIPTTQNHANIHLDIQKLVADYAQDGVDDAKMELLCSMLVRAYDPCISCSVH